MRAAARGFIDFSRARLRDVDWWRRTRLILKELGDQSDLEIMKAAYQFQGALVANGSLTDDSFKRVQGGAKETFNEIVNALHPWDARTTAQVRQDEIGGLVQLYKKLVGDPDDPAFAARMAEATRRFDDRKQEEVGETEEERVGRLVAEHRRERERRVKEATGRR